VTETPTCATGCTYRGRHTTDCACTTDCTDHPDHCRGCLPRRADIGHLCQHCHDRTLDALHAIPELTVHAASRTDGRLNLPSRPRADGIHTRPTTTPSPSPAWDTADDAITWAWRWAEAAADHLHQHGPLHVTNAGLPPRNLGACCRYLAAHLDQLAAWDAGPDLASEARALARALERVSGRDDLTHRLKTVCPSCGRRTLAREDGAGQVTCRNRDCQRVWRDGEYEWLARTGTEGDQ